MPPREAKGRYLTREYFADHDFMTRLSAETREFYLLLSLFADDAGWLEWDPDYLMFSIYRYFESRVTDFSFAVARLEQTGRLRTFRCGHAVMPKVAKRPRSGVQETKVRDAHDAQCGPRNKKPVSKPSGPHRVQSGRNDPTLSPTLPNPTLRRTSTLPTARARAGGAEANGTDDGGESAKDILKRMGYEPPRVKP